MAEPNTSSSRLPINRREGGATSSVRDGASASGRSDKRQVRALQASSADGVSLYLRPDPGSASELALVGA
ncbi:MAG: hypothetical protein LC790_13230, partial [Actinobacteria bacterium]|nr:hypothetical protein [Actinomycetota bacterium]